MTDINTVIVKSPTPTQAATSTAIAGAFAVIAVFHLNQIYSHYGLPQISTEIAQSYQMLIVGIVTWAAHRWGGA